MISFDIVIVNWNTGLSLHECLQSISSSMLSSDYHLENCVIVDNSSNDNPLIELNFPDLPVMTIVNHENKGFAFACNQGASEGDGKYILFLNPDVQLFPDTLAQALSFLEDDHHQDVGILGVQLVDGNGTVQRNVARFPTPMALFTQMLGLDRIWPNRFPPHFLNQWDHRENRQVDQVEGAFYLVPRKVFRELNGFDAIFFMYYEDLDFALRAKKAGWNSYYLADARAVHTGGAASSQIKAKRLSYVLNSRVLYVAKHFSVIAAVGILIASYAVEFWTRLGWCVLTQSWHNFVDTLRGYAMFLKSMPALVAKLGSI